MQYIFKEKMTKTGSGWSILYAIHNSDKRCVAYSFNRKKVENLLSKINNKKYGFGTYDIPKFFVASILELDKVV
jgi:hypothetical protein